MLTLEDKLEVLTDLICRFVRASDVPAWIWDAAGYLIVLQTRLDMFCTR